MIVKVIESRTLHTTERRPMAVVHNLYAGMHFADHPWIPGIVSQRGIDQLCGNGSVITKRSTQMNWDQVEGNWKQIGGKAKQRWGQLTDSNLLQIAGRRDELIGKVQEAYGATKDNAERQVEDWLAGLDRDDATLEANRIGANSKTPSNGGGSDTEHWIKDAKRDVEQRVGAVSNRVHERPLASLAVAAGVGFVIGVLLSRH
jgi:uncharacterized protein YjbJ (UPF0337 family)